MRTVRIGDKIVISHSHPSLDAIFEATVTRARLGIITLEWKANWKRLEEYLPEQRSKCPSSPADNLPSGHSHRGHLSGEGPQCSWQAHLRVR